MTTTAPSARCSMPWSPRCSWRSALYGVVVPALTPLFPSAEIARALRNVVCVGPKAAAAGFQEPSLVFMTGTSTLLTDGSGAADFLKPGQLPVRAGRSALGARFCPARRSDRAALQRRDPRSTAIISRKAGRSRSRSSAPKARSKMSAPADGGEAAGYFSRLFAVVRMSHDAIGAAAVASAPRRSGAQTGGATRCCSSRRRRSLVVALMVAVDVPEIKLMPPRGTPGLWPVRILTDFGKAAFVLWSIGGDCCSRVAVVAAPGAAMRAIPAAAFWRPRSAICVSCRAGAGPRRRSRQMDRRARPAVCRRQGQRLQLRRISPEPRPMPAFRRRMRSPASRWLSRSPRCGRGRGCR